METGVYWKHYIGDELYDSKQSINLIEVWLDSSSVRYQVAFNADSLSQTSRLAKRNQAIAAINGSFFNREGGNPIPFLKIDGNVISEGVARRDLYIDKGGVAIAENGEFKIIKKPQTGWKRVNYPTVMSSGPLLIYRGKVESFGNDPFHENRHPRTAVALTNDNRLYLVTIDGRSFQSYGMTIRELAEFLKQLGAIRALNLDGGGSTTMWIDTTSRTGVVNYPSDNLEFDHAGERPISNALLIIQ
jgi:exopolysaccharide biosynthesis protein